MERRDQVIYAQAGWQCQMPQCLCPDGRVIDPFARHPDPWSPSIDHIHPRSRGGGEGASNKRAAHLRCNVSGFGEHAAKLSVSTERDLGWRAYCNWSPGTVDGPPWTNWEDLTRADAGKVLTRVVRLTDDQAGRLLWSAVHALLVQLPYSECALSVEVMYDCETKRYSLRYF